MDVWTKAALERACMVFVLVQAVPLATGCGRDDGQSSDEEPAPLSKLVAIGTVSGSTNEAGKQASFDVVLAARPEHDVVLPLESGNVREGTLDKGTLLFTRDNWNAPQTVTVTGRNDDEADGSQRYEVVFGAMTSRDERFDGQIPPRVALVNQDDETAGFTVGEVRGETAERGDEASFTLVLNSRPSADVIVSLESSEPTEAEIDETQLSFTAQNWNAPQVITVTGQDDDVADGSQTAAPCRSFPHLDRSIEFSTTLKVAWPPVSLVERLMALTMIPAESSSMFVSGTSSNAMLEETSATFTDADWNSPQLVTVTGEDDAFADGDQPFRVVFGPTTSSDAAYAAITPPDLDLVNIDDDSAGITVSALSGPTNEMGGQATFRVVLNSRPFEAVTVNFVSSDPGEGLLDATSLTFTGSDWSTPRTVTVTGQDDDLADGGQPFFIVFEATTSLDPAYAALTPPNLAATNLDDDSVGIIVSTISGNTGEDGAEATFTVVLTSQPYADVTVRFDSDDPSEGIVAATSLVFTAANWEEPQTVVVYGMDDDEDDGDQAYGIAFAPTLSDDLAYHGRVPARVSVTNVNDDAPEVLITTGNVAYGHHGACSGWNACGDAATCALWACEAEGYSRLVSYGRTAACSSRAFSTCHLFRRRGDVQYNWGSSCAVMGVSDIVCGN